MRSDVQLRKPLLAIVAALLSLCGCAAPPAQSVGATTPFAEVTGTVSYRERTALLPGAVIRVQLLDVSRMDAAAVIVAEQSIRLDGQQVPLLFDLRYDPATIKPQNEYAVRAWLEDREGRMRFTTDQRSPVLTRGAPAHVDLVMKGIGSGVPALRP